MDRFSDPVLFEQMSSSELVQGALITTLMGMGTTFVVLTLLWAVIAIISKVIKRTEGKRNVKQAPTPAAAPTKAQAASAAVTEPAPASTGTGPELIAVITAAIAAMEGSVSSSNLIIRKISRISGNNTSWGKAGVSEIIDSRKF